jgi:hypothetical protein
MNGQRRLEEFIVKLSTAQHDTKQVELINEIKLIVKSHPNQQTDNNYNNKSIK